MPDLSAEHRDTLSENLQSVMNDAEALLEATAEDASSGIAELRSRVQETLAKAKDGLADAQHVLKDRAKSAAHSTEGYVQDHPWKAISVAAGMGLLVGILIGRR